MTMKMVSVASLKSRLSHYLRQVRRGREVIITSHDHPVGKLVPYPGDAVNDLRIIPPSRPLRDLRNLKSVPPRQTLRSLQKIKGVRLSHPVDVVALLREDRDAR